MTSTRSERLTTLVEVGGHHEDRPAGRAQAADAIVNELDRADVDPARGLAHEQHLGGPVDLPGQHQLLLIAARERGRALPRAAPAGRRTRPSAPGCRRRPPASRAGGRGRSAARGGSRGWPIHTPGTPSPDRSAGGPRARGPPRGGGRSRPSAAAGSPSSRIRPAATGRSPASASRSSLCPLPAIPAIPTISPARTTNDTSSTPGRPGGVADRHPFHAQQRPAGPARRRRRGRADPPPHHQLREFRRRGLRRAAMGHGRPVAHDGDPVGHRHDLRQLVRDQDDRLALAGEPAEHAKQPVRLPRGQHAGRLVQDQHVRPRGTAPSGSPRAGAARRAGRPPGRPSGPPGRTRAPASPVPAGPAGPPRAAVGRPPRPASRSRPRRTSPPA